MLGEMVFALDLDCSIPVRHGCSAKIDIGQRRIQIVGNLSQASTHGPERSLRTSQLQSHLRTVYHLKDDRLIILLPTTNKPSLRTKREKVINHGDGFVRHANESPLRDRP
jgi:hypothetical protein